MCDELRSPGAPVEVREWLDGLPGWVEVREPAAPDGTLNLDPGEREAIALALELWDDLVLLDERRGRREAAGRGLAVTGTPGLLDAAARRELIELEEALASLRRTSFRARPNLLQELSQPGREQDG